MMPLEIFIVDTATGTERLVQTSDERWGEGAVEYEWTDGNYGCDCNRSLFYARAVGEVEPDVLCGDQKYLLRAVQDGTVVYDETKVSV